MLSMRARFWIQVLTLCGCISATVVAQQALPCKRVHVTYEEYVPTKSQIQVEKVPRSPKPTLADVKRTPQGTKWLTRNQPDFTKNGPWTTTILVGDENGAFLKLTFPNHGNEGVTAEWLNEQLLLVRFWLGRIVSVDLILNVETEKFIYSEAANYGELVQPCE